MSEQVAVPLPSRKKSTRLTPTLSVAVEDTVTVPAAVIGETGLDVGVVTVGGVVSAPVVYSMCRSGSVPVLGSSQVYARRRLQVVADVTISARPLVELPVHPVRFTTS